MLVDLINMSDKFKVFWCDIIPEGRQMVWVEERDRSNCPNGKPGLMYHFCRVVLPTNLTREQWDQMTWDDAYAQALALKPKCSCGFELTAENSKCGGRGMDRLYKRADTGEVYEFSQLPVGAMWDADYLHDNPRYTGADGISLHVMLPDRHTWCVDSEANNCTRPGDRTHKCWVRHGDPRKGEMHVDKNGNTCAAGAGSILTDKWHGFLHNNYLHE
jgi:hypothetical protein